MTIERVMSGHEAFSANNGIIVNDQKLMELLGLKLTNDYRFL